MTSNKGPPARRRYNTSWEPVAAWYHGWAGGAGSEHHRRLAIPAALDQLALRPGERLLDIGAGHGVLAPYVARTGAIYTGVELSETLIRFARTEHGHAGRFLLGDARTLARVPGLMAGQFDAAVFLLSVQDMEPLDAVLASAAWSLKPGGRLVLLMTHPCFRVPRQSGWGWDERRRLRYRRIDRYLTPLPVPMKAYGHRRGMTRTFHYPLETYVNTLAALGLVVDALREIPTYRRDTASANARADHLADQEIPLFLALRARKQPGA